MMDMFKELLKKKRKDGEEEMDPTEKKAKMDVLGEIRDLATKDMGDEVRGLKKVTVAADSEKGVMEGLNKAKDVIEGKLDDAKTASDKAFPSDDAEEKDEMDHMDDDELEAMIAALQAKKAKRQSAVE
jgi:hypothetical protein